jgi:hypothetical protein
MTPRKDVNQFEASQALSLKPENAIAMHDAVVMYEILHPREEARRLLQRAPRSLLDELSRLPDVKGAQQDPRFQELIQTRVTR